MSRAAVSAAASPVVIAALGAGAAALLVVGLVLALTGRFGAPVGLAEARPSAPLGPSEYRIVAIGDSLSAGTGDARAGGYPGRLARMLRERGRSATVVNLAVPGAESGDVLARVEAPDVRAALAAANLIVASAAGNDLSHTIRPEPGALPVDQTGTLGGFPGPPAKDSARQAELRPRESDAAAARARANLKTLVARLRALNPTAPIRLIGLYNPFEVAPADAASARAQLLSWNDLIDEAAASTTGAVAIPVADLFVERPDRLAGDHYHPGARGHELIAERVLQTLPEGDLRPSAGD